MTIKTDGEAPIIRPLRGGKKARVRKSASRMMSVHYKPLRKLAK